MVKSITSVGIVIDPYGLTCLNIFRLSIILGETIITDSC